MSKHSHSVHFGGGQSSLSSPGVHEGVNETCHPERKRRISKAFTLAEVLITLGIIGVVAAMTMPSLVQKYKEQETVTRVKKFYSVFSQAYTMAILDHGTLDNWGLSASELVEIPDEDSEEEGATIPVHSEESLENYDKFFQIMKPYLKTAVYEKFNGDRGEAAKGFVLADGTAIVGMWLSANCSTSGFCGDFYIQTNSNDNNNRLGDNSKTYFGFILYKNKIVPYGLDEYTFKNQCLSGERYSRCTGWVMYNENMDYLRCNDLSWNGKKKCK